MHNSLFPEPTLSEISRRLRDIRVARGFSLADVEKASMGKLKAATLGSYERSDRALCVKRAIELANFFGVPLTYLLTGSSPNEVVAEDLECIFDLRRIRLTSRECVELNALTQFLAHIAQRRSDWNGEILSIRASDHTVIAILLRVPESHILGWLHERDLLLKKTTGPDRP